MDIKQIGKILLAASCYLLVASFGASAYEYNYGNAGFKLTGYGTAGALNPDFESPVFIGDWRVRGQFDYTLSEGKKLGAVYAIDQIAIDENRAARDAFIFGEDKELGKIEFGFTESVVRKIGLGVPDVGGLRFNDKPIFYKKMPPDGPVISDTTLNSGRYSLRTNLATAPTNGPVQYAMSVSGITGDYKYGIDLGMKYRQPEGKTKTSFSLGASFIDSPDSYSADMFAPDVTADWRAQFAGGLNLQYNSWIFGVATRLIYDQNPIGIASDGLLASTGVSYDILNYSISASYIFSDTGIWDNNDLPDYMAHTGLLSFRYKYSEYWDIWMSLGITTDTPFMSAGLRLTF